MMDKKGLPDNVVFSAIPTCYLNMIMPGVDSLDELKLSLLMFGVLYKKKGSPQYVSLSDLMADPAVTMNLGHGKCTGKSLKQALDNVVDRGVFIHLEVTSNNKHETVYFINNPTNQQIVKNIKNGTVQLDLADIESELTEPAGQLPNIFAYYEENIGMLTPLIADELRLAENTYPQPWIIEAIREAVVNNKRNWRYILRILERWLSEGKTNGAYRQNNSQEDPNKYTRGKYQRFVRH